MMDGTEDHDAPAQTGVSDRTGIELRADVTEREGRPDECTIWPQDASGKALLTRWIAAEEGSFVALSEMR